MSKLIKRKEIKLLWHEGFWDGPYSGMCMYKNEKYWFDIVKDRDFKSRVFKLIKPTKEQLEKMEYDHELFRKYVGTHTDYDENEKRHFDGKKPQGEGGWQKYHDLIDNNGHPDLKYSFTKDQTVGYFLEWD